MENMNLASGNQASSSHFSNANLNLPDNRNNNDPKFEKPKSKEYLMLERQRDLERKERRERREAIRNGKIQAVRNRPYNLNCEKSIVQHRFQGLSKKKRKALRKRERKALLQGKANNNEGTLPVPNSNVPKSAKELNLERKQMLARRRALRKAKREGMKNQKKMNKKNRQKWTKLLGSIFLSTKVKAHIQRVLSSHIPTNFVVDDNSYINITDSTFKREFISNIHGNFEENLLPFSLDSKQDPRLDEVFYNELASKQDADFVYRSWQKRREALPAYKMRNQILDLIDSSQVVVISGETGCGKTTQVPQFILDDCLLKKQGSMCRIVCTQPRRISAISVAERVAEERNEPAGRTCGYSVRLERKLPRDRGAVVFCTVGIVLRHLEWDPSLESVSHLIIDEIHEREINVDFLMCIIKQIIAVRKDLKVILMSATLNAEAFSAYFNNAPHMNIPGFTYPVEEYYLEHVIETLNYRFPPLPNKSKKSLKKVTKYVNESLVPLTQKLEASGQFSRSTIEQLQNPKSEELDLNLVYALLLHICDRDYEKGAVLIFMPGFAEISSFLKKLDQSGKFTRDRYILLPLHSQIPTMNQKEVFNPAPFNKRKIIVATNIAETSITIEDVVYVIDCGKMKVNSYDADSNIQSLQSEWVSLANAAQRKGRAGRTQPGKCFHLFASTRDFPMFLKPEILRTRLENTILAAKKLQVGKIKPFFEKLIDSPSDRAAMAALKLLRRLDAIDDDENLTPLGYHLAKLPVSPQVGKMLLYGVIFSCLDPILSIAASLDFKDAFVLPFGMQNQIAMKRQELAEGYRSDHYLLYKALNRFESARNKRAFCHEFFLSFQTMSMIVQLKDDFMKYLQQMQFVVSQDSKNPRYNWNSDNKSLIKAVVCAGLYPNIAVSKNGSNKRTFKLPDSQGVMIHPKSVLDIRSGEMFYESNILIYYTLIKSTCNYIHDATLVHPLPVIIFGDQFKRETIDGHDYASIGEEGLLFKCSQSTLNLIEELRNRLKWFLTHKISHPGYVDWSRPSPEVDLLRTITDIITDEDQGNLEMDAFEDYDEKDPVFKDFDDDAMLEPDDDPSSVNPNPSGEQDIEELSDEDEPNPSGEQDIEEISDDEEAEDEDEIAIEDWNC